MKASGNSRAAPKKNSDILVKHLFPSTVESLDTNVNEGVDLNVWVRCNPHCDTFHVLKIRGFVRSLPRPTTGA